MRTCSLIKALVMIGVPVLSLSLAGTTAALAFGGCVDSPESPTWILGGLGVVAAGVPWLRARLKHRHKR